MGLGLPKADEETHTDPYGHPCSCGQAGAENSRDGTGSALRRPKRVSVKTEKRWEQLCIGLLCPGCVLGVLL